MIRKIIKSACTIAISTLLSIDSVTAYAKTDAHENNVCIEEGLFEEELKIINRRIEYEMLPQGDEKEEKISEIDNRMRELEIEVWNI